MISQRTVLCSGQISQNDFVGYDPRKIERKPIPVKQFKPYYYLNDSNDQYTLKQYTELMNRQKTVYGGSIIALGNRIPSSGFYTFDQATFNEHGIEWDLDNLLGQLISTCYYNLGYVERIY